MQKQGIERYCIKYKEKVAPSHYHQLSLSSSTSSSLRRPDAHMEGLWQTEIKEVDGSHRLSSCFGSHANLVKWHFRHVFSIRLRWMCLIMSVSKENSINKQRTKKKRPKTKYRKKKKKHEQNQNNEDNFIMAATQSC